jgi:hypothetical protein
MRSRTGEPVDGIRSSCALYGSYAPERQAVSRRVFVGSKHLNGMQSLAADQKLLE